MRGFLRGITRRGMSPGLRTSVLSGSIRPIFSADLQSSLVPGVAIGSGTPTYTRASVATVTEGVDGRVIPVLSGEARFVGARRVRNYATWSENFNNAAWTKVGVTVTTSATAPDGSITEKLAFAGAADNRIEKAALVSFTGTGVASVELCADAPCSIQLSASGEGRPTGAATLSVTTAWKRFSVSRTMTAKNGYLILSTSGVAVTLYARKAQWEDVTGQSNTNCSEYCSVGVLSAPYHGAGVDGVKYFTTLNGNTVSSNVVTEATGALITPAAGGNASVTDAQGPLGYLAEGARSNLCLYSRDIAAGVTATGNWALTDCTAATTATGMGGVANSATTLTATGANATCLQPFTIASAVKTYSVGIKRKTGTGKVYITLDNDSTRTEVTSLINASTYTVVQATQTLANPTIGIKIETSGDALYVDYNQLEAASFASSPIATTTASVERKADVDALTTSGNLSSPDHTIYLEWTPTAASQGTVYLWGSYVDANNSTAILHDGTNVIYRKRIGGVDVDATKALAYAAGTTYKIAARNQSGVGSIFVAGVKGTDGAATAAPQLGTTFQIGTDGNGSNAGSCAIRKDRNFARALSDSQVAAIG